jgi:hypothetical protein
MVASIRLQEALEFLELGLRECNLNLTKERWQAHLSQSFTNTGQYFDLPEHKKIGDKEENLRRKNLDAGTSAT